MKFLVMGSSGMTGHMVVQYLYEQGNEVISFARRQLLPVPTIIGDARESEKIERLIVGGNFDAIVNCIAVLNHSSEQDYENACFCNAYFPHFLVKVTADLPTKVIHISSDGVFDGKQGGYIESSRLNAQTFYGRTKGLGEVNDNKNLTLRTSIIGPDINKDGVGLLNWFAHQSDMVNGYQNVIWTGVTSLELAKVLPMMVSERITGLYHLVPDASISKCQLLQLINYYLFDEKKKIRPTDDVTSDHSLINTRKVLHYNLPLYEEMIKEVACWTRRHHQLYSHYAL